MCVLHEELDVMADHILEWAPFRLRAGADEAALLHASERLQREFLTHQEGFLRRELIKGAERSYVDLVWWESFAVSQAAMKKAASSPACKSYFALMECSAGDPSHDVLLYSVTASYRPSARLLALAI